MITVADLKRNESAVVIRVNLENEMKRHLADMGVVPGCVMVLKRKAPFGNPYLYKVMDYLLSIRLSEAEKIEAERI